MEREAQLAFLFSNKPGIGVELFISCVVGGWFDYQSI
jgi:hypothetical protein